jgi:hypothetical protein
MRRFALLLIALFALPPCAQAHRLDDYIQAARLAVARDGVAIELDLTPGAAIAPAIFPLIDTDGNTLVSVSEIESYARALLRDITFEVDGVSRPLTLTRAESPSWGEFRDGIGVIAIEARADVSLAAGSHRIRFENRHRRDVGVYLANALVPVSPAITIVRQDRDVYQRRFDLDIDVRSAGTVPSWIIAQVLLVGALLAFRARR